MKGIKAASITALVFSFATSAMTNYFAYLGDVLESEEHRYALESCMKASSRRYRREANEYSSSGAGLMRDYSSEPPSVALGVPGDSLREGGPSFGNFIVRSWGNGLGEIFDGF